MSLDEAIASAVTEFGRRALRRLGELYNDASAIREHYTEHAVLHDSRVPACSSCASPATAAWSCGSALSWLPAEGWPAWDFEPARGRQSQL